MIYTASTAAELENALIADGFTQREDRFTKPSKVDDAAGGYAVIAIARVVERVVDGGPNYFDIRFS